MPEQVRGDHGVAVGQDVHRREPDIRSRGDPVDQDDQGAVAGHSVADAVAVEGHLLEVEVVLHSVLHTPVRPERNII